MAWVNVKTKKLKGGGPHWSAFGIWEYLSQSNDNVNCVNESERFKFVDNLSFLEILYLLSVVIASYNFRAHIPSHIPVHNQVIPAENLISQQQLTEINNWTHKMKMKLYVKDMKNMILNFQRKNNL